jgi:hypothetical protein
VVPCHWRNSGLIMLASDTIGRVKQARSLSSARRPSRPDSVCGGRLGEVSRSLNTGSGRILWRSARHHRPIGGDDVAAAPRNRGGPREVPGTGGQDQPGAFVDRLARGGLSDDSNPCPQRPKRHPLRSRMHPVSPPPSFSNCVRRRRDAGPFAPTHSCGPRWHGSVASKGESEPKRRVGSSTAARAPSNAGPIASLLGGGGFYGGSPRGGGTTGINLLDADARPETHDAPTAPDFLTKPA